jgi:hypothetical protein
MARWMVSIEGDKSEEDISESMLGRVFEAEGVGAENNNIISSSDGSRNSKAAPIPAPAPNGNSTKTVTAVKVSQDRKHNSTTSSRNQVVTAKRAHRTRSSVADPSELFGGIEEVGLPPTKRRTAKKNGARRPRLQAGETSVETVPLLTGTLFLYRGLHRRAEFIRTK